VLRTLCVPQTMLGASIIAALAAYALPVVDAVASQTYTWKQVKIGGGGGFVPGKLILYIG
jgi:hypothetical protein